MYLPNIIIISKEIGVPDKRLYFSDRLSVIKHKLMNERKKKIYAELHYKQLLYYYIIR